MIDINNTDYRVNTGIPIIPESIVVHLGAPGSDGENITVGFDEYIKNVASSEIYPTWPEAALRANIYAQISFALNRIYSEFYRSRGYNYDITSSPSFDQTYIRERDIFENISYIVDEIFTSYIRRRGNIEPLFAEYCDGINKQCDGLSQWGSVYAANEGLTPIEILRRYYGEDIELVVNAPVGGVVSSLPSKPLSLGSVGNDVAIMQSRLNRVSTNYPNIPKIKSVNGIFDSDTDAAVRKFQKTFNLEPDGIVFNATWFELIRVYNAVKRLNELNSEGETLDDIPILFPETIQFGDAGNSVRIVQFYLNYVSDYLPTVPKISIDGYFGPETENAVRAFQRAFGIPENGVVDEKTFDVLYDFYLGVIASLPDDIFENRARPYPGKALLLGVENSDVLYLQKYLNLLAEEDASLKSVSEDGIFGTSTEEAVKIFQAEYGLPVTGIVGANTWLVLAEQYDNILAGKYRLDGQYSP